MFEIEDEIIEQKLYELNDMYSDENLSQISFEIKNLQQILRKHKLCFNQLLKIKVPITNTNEMKEMNEQNKEYKLKLVALKRKESDLRAKVEKSIKILKSYNLDIPAPPGRRINK